MKQLKKGLLIFLCTLAFTSLTACGSSNEDNGAVKQEDNTRDNNNNMNDATDGTRNEGALDEAGDDVRNAADNMADDVRDGMEDMKN